MKLLIKKEWKLTVTPVPLLFLLLSGLVLVPSYPYYVTFFYNALGIFLMLQAARENRDVYYTGHEARSCQGALLHHHYAAAAADRGVHPIHAHPQELCGDQ